MDRAPLRALSWTDALFALLAAAGALALFGTTACPSLFVGDCAELATASAVLGIPHPPGYPLFTAVTGLLARVLPGADAAGRANLAVALEGAVAVGLLARLVLRLGGSRSAAWLAALSLAAGRTFWSQCVAVEVYAFDVLLLVASLSALLEAAERPASVRRVALAAAVTALWIGHRTVNVLYLPAILALVNARLGPVRPTRRSLASGLLAFVAVVLAPLFALLARSAADPPLDVGDPETLPRLWEVVRGAPYARHLGDASAERVASRLARFLGGGLSGRELGAAFHVGLLALLGALRPGASPSGSPRRGELGALALLVVLVAAFSSTYAVLDVEVFLLPAWTALALAAALGWDRALGRRADHPAASLAALALAALPLALNLRAVDLSEHRLTRLCAETLLDGVPPGALVLVNGDTTIHGAWYLQAVEARRPDVTVLSLGHAVPWHVAQLRARHPEVAWPELDAVAGPAAFARAVLLANIDARPVCVSPSVDARELLRPDGARGFEAFPRGLVQQVYATGQSLNLRELLEGNLALVEGLAERLGPVPRTPDMDSRSALVQLAAILFLSAERARQAGWAELERRALHACLRFEPDVHERAIHDDVLDGLGLETPVHRFGARARARLAELDGRPASPADDRDG